MFDRTYQPGVAATPATVADEGERVQVWRPGFGWVDRPVEVEQPEVGREVAAA